MLAPANAFCGMRGVQRFRPLHPTPYLAGTNEVIHQEHGQNTGLGGKVERLKR